MSARTLIFTGNGKGKTTAALGMVLRAAGHRQRVLVVQFIKSNNGTGEIVASRHLPGVEIVQIGCGFVPAADHPEFAVHTEKAEQALAFAIQAVISGKYELIVLDEICGAVARGLIEEEAVVELLLLPERKSTLVLTGRNASERLIALADTVTEMKNIRHGFDQGIIAQEGVEF